MEKMSARRESRAGRNSHVWAIKTKLHTYFDDKWDSKHMYFDKWMELTKYQDRFDFAFEKEKVLLL